VPDLDLFNASLATVHSFRMVTHNTADYKHVPGLALADWFPLERNVCERSVGQLGSATPQGEP
jgi:hypothetical protein